MNNEEKIMVIIKIINGYLTRIGAIVNGTAAPGGMKSSLYSMTAMIIYLRYLRKQYPDKFNEAVEFVNIVKDAIKIADEEEK